MHLVNTFTETIEFRTKNDKYDVVILQLVRGIFGSKSIKTIVELWKDFGGTVYFLYAFVDHENKCPEAYERVVSKLNSDYIGHDVIVSCALSPRDSFSILPEVDINAIHGKLSMPQL